MTFEVNSMSHAMNVRRRLPAALMITLLWGCGPAYQDLKQGAAEAPDVYAYTSEACEGYEAEEGCVRFIGEICEALHTRTAAKAVAQIEADDLDGAARTLSTLSTPPCPPGAERFQPDLEVLEALRGCGDERACVAEILDGALAAQARPVIGALIQRSKASVCDHFAATATGQLKAGVPSDLGDSAAGAGAPSFADMEVGVATLERATRWCDAEGLARPVAAFEAALDRLARVPSRSVAAYEACRVRLSRWTAADREALCAGAKIHARRYLEIWVAEGLSSGELSGDLKTYFAEAMIRRYHDLEMSDAVEAGPLAAFVGQPRPPAVGIQIEVKASERLGDYVFHTSSAARRLAPRLAPWADVSVGEPLSGQRRANLRAKLRLPAAMVVDRDERIEEDTSRYLSGFRDVPNPDFLAARQRCQDSEDALERCEQAYALDMTRFDDCERRQRQERSRYEACQQKGRSGCYLSSSSCTRPTRCSTTRKSSDCGAVYTIPETVREEVWSDHRYAIRHVTQRATLPLEIVVEGPDRRALEARVVDEVRDAQVEPAPQFNVQGDPLELPTQAQTVVRVSNLAAARLYAELEHAHERLCADLKATASEAPQFAEVALVMEAERYQCP